MKLAGIFGAVAALLLLVAGIGILLPARWTASAARVVPVTGDSLHAVLARPTAWRQWMPFPESGVVPFGPEAGKGAGLTWDDPVYGRGRFEILEAVSPTSLAYRVTVEEGQLVMSGRLELSPEDGGTRIRWTETGEGGWNPILGYQALFMEDFQGGQLRETIDRLRESLGADGTDATADALSLLRPSAPSPPAPRWIASAS